jgi:hypothetical protein
MKKKIVVVGLMALSILGFAQSPEKMSYQAVIRDASSNLVSSSAVGIQISILQGSVSGNSVYTETHTTNTNVNGLASLEIGAGNVTSGNFSSIDWGNGPYFIKTETDPTGGTNYSITATSQLLSVPYALHAQSAGNVNNVETLTVNGFGETTIELADGTTLTDGIGGFLTLTDTIATRIMIENTGLSDNAPDYDAWMKFRFPSVAEWSFGMDATDNAFKIDNTGTIGASPEISLLQNGNLGIGTPAPERRLHIVSEANPIRLQSFVDGCYVELFTPAYLNSSTRAGWLGYGGATDSNFTITNQIPTGSIRYRTNNQVRMTINHLGNIGIGTTAPSSMLHVASDIRTNGALIIESQIGLTAYPTSGTSMIYSSNNSAVTPPFNNTGNLILQASPSLARSIFMVVGGGANTPKAKLIVSGHPSSNVDIIMDKFIQIVPSATPPAGPTKGFMYFDDVTNKLRVFDGTTWQNCW